MKPLSKLKPGRWALALWIGASIGVVPGVVAAHNNPQFSETLIARIEMQCAAQACADSEPFTLDWDKKTVQLVWRVSANDPQAVRFSLRQGTALALESIADGDTTRRVRGADLRIVDLSAGDGAVVIDVYAKRLDRGKKTP